jgi:hypothetical protein
MHAQVHAALMDPPVVSLYLQTAVINESIFTAFPNEIRAIDELLILCDSFSDPASEGWNHANLALLVARPKEASFRLYPQDWFNTADFDFGYQWITRIARDPQTGRVRGEGFRMNSFELDDTLRDVVKVL